MKRGFTLIELLAVIVILAIISLIAVPIVINIIEDTKKSSQEESLRQYGRAIENGIANYLMKNPTAKPETLTMEDIKDYVKYSGGEKIECEPVQINEKGKIYLANCSINNIKVEYTYGEKQRDPNITVDLIQGLTPVIYDGDNWKVVDKNDPNWYDYDEQKWANAVVLRNDVTKTKGQTVTVEGNNPEVLMMLVYIPRYEYRIEGDFGKGGQSADLPGEIEVNFIGKNKTTPTEGYHINDAFNFDGAKSGFWVGKFELSHETLSSNTTANNLGCSTTSCTNASGLRILPNVVSLRRNTVSNFWYGIKSIENTNLFGLSNMDTHMMKNSEWGAVAYLSQSKYGKYGNNNYDNKYKEVYQNKSDNYITGSSNGTPSQSTTNTQCVYNDMQDLGEDTNGYKKGQCGPGASTTGNIYGVYDMSGGSIEYVMGVYGAESPTIGNSGFVSTVFTGNTIESKYYDKYANSTNSDTNDGSLSCNNGICYGHGISEIKGSTTSTGWYGDHTYMVCSSYPWFLRGGHSNYNTIAGVFYRGSNNGNSNGDGKSARVVGFGK